MKQKLALSCALIHNPKLLILDEPTTGVDPLSRRQFWEILLQLKRDGATIVVSTPYMDEVARADRACFILADRKLSEGTPAALAAEFEGKIYFADHEPDSEIVTALNSVEGLSARRFGAGLRIYIDQDSRIESFGRQLQSAGIAGDKLKQIPPELEDRFIQLMGTVK